MLLLLIDAIWLCPTIIFVALAVPYLYDYLNNKPKN